MDSNEDRKGGLLRWQWSLYPEGHRDRKNLAVHAATVPLFLAGTCLLAAAPIAGAGLAIAGAATMIGTVAAQGRGHAREAVRPVRFRGALDVVARLFVEQWVTFPRFVLDGGFGEAWRAGKPK